MKKRFLYCSVHTAPKDFELIFKQNGGVESVAQKYHTLFSNGLSINLGQRITVLSSPPTKKLWFKLFDKSQNISFYYVPHIPIKYISQFVSYIYIFIFAVVWHMLHIFERRVIVISATQIFKFSAVKIISKIFCSQLMLITCDIPHMTLEQRLSKLKHSKSIIRRVSKDISYYLWTKVKNFDYFVFLTKEMNKVVNIYNKKYVIVEGFSDNSLAKSCNVDSKFEKNIIVYAGGLYEKYGIKMLVNAVENNYFDNVELWLFGAGEMVDYLQSTKFKKTKYLGLKLNHEIFEIEKKATLLINPRFSNEEYTEYSFPSKIIEYMSTGTLTITTKLKGIPEEYFNYCIPIDNETEDGISRAIKYALSLTQEERSNLGNKAANFVLNNKDYISQTSKVLQMLSE